MEKIAAPVSLSFALGLLLVSMPIHGNIVTPTLLECDQVEAGLDSFDTLTPSDQQWVADTGRDCEATYPALYDAEPYLGGDGETCDAYGDILDVSCAHAKGKSPAASRDECEDEDGADPGPSYGCYRLYEHAVGWSSVPGTAGLVTATGEEINDCAWVAGAAPICSTDEAINARWELKGTEACHTVVASTEIYAVLVAGPALPAGTSVDFDYNACQ